jgi:hypothetical protein
MVRLQSAWLRFKPGMVSRPSSALYFLRHPFFTTREIVAYPQSFDSLDSFHGPSWLFMALHGSS